MSSGITRPLVQGAMREDLRESGIGTPTCLKKLGVRAMLPEEVQAITKIDIPGYSIPYFDVRGKQIPFTRIKFLAEVPGEPGQKYWQKPDSLPHVYFPPFVPWSEIVVNTDVPIFITEGEKKAACAAQNKIPCIGLGGVWSFKSKKAGKPLIAEMERIDWRNRDVFVVFDNDLMFNPDVLRAIETLTSALLKQGAKDVRSVYLPASSEKIGLDDFLVSKGVRAFRNLPSESVSPLVHRLNDLNTKYAIVRNLGSKIFDLDVRLFYNVRDFVGAVEAPNQLDVVDSNGTPKTVSVAKEWVEWSNRRVMRNIVFAPGKPHVTKENDVNLWEGYPYVPKKGSAAPFLELVDHVLGEVPRDVKRWFLRWVAYPLQNPGSKLYTSVLVWGVPGSGKTFLGKIIKNLYGAHGRWVNNLSTSSSFNEWAVNAQFVMADEVVFHGDRRESNQLKNLITQEEVIINQKYQPSYTVRDYTNYYFTSNHQDALHLDPNDRRFLIVEVSTKKSAAFYRRLDKWLERPESYEAVMYYLMNVDLANFNPKAEAPLTRQKEDMIHETMSSLDQVLTEAMESPDEFFSLGGSVIERDLFTSDEVMMLLPRELRSSSRTAVGKSLKRVGAIKRGVNLKSSRGRRVYKRLYAVRTPSEWAKRSERDWATEYGKTGLVIPDNVVKMGSKKSKKRSKKRRRKFRKPE